MMMVVVMKKGENEEEDEEGDEDQDEDEEGEEDEDASGPRASNAVCHGRGARPRAAARHGKISTLPSGSPLSISAHGRA